MAQLTSKVFQILDNRHTRAGDEIFVAAGVTTCEPGMLMRFNSGSTVVLADKNNVSGIAFGTRALAYRPTTQVFDPGEPVVLIQGGGECLVSGDFFDNTNTLPSAGSPVYAAATSGLWSATAAAGAIQIGYCRRQETVQQPVGVNGTNVTVARIVFEIPSF